MKITDYAKLDDKALGELLLISEDRLPLAAALEIARRDSMLAPLSQLLCDRQSWLSELPEWWSVVHGAFILGRRGGEAVVTPLLTALRWADAYDCDWVAEMIPSIFGQLGTKALPGLTRLTQDVTSGWSARACALQSLAAVTLSVPAAEEEVFRFIGRVFMDEAESRPLRQMAGIILLDFRQENYRMALAKFAREQLASVEDDYWGDSAFSSEDVDSALRAAEAETYFYQQDWMQFYAPGEIQRRQKRWQKERLLAGRRPPNPFGGGGRPHSIRNFGDDKTD
jgi:hypothetical protein